MPRQKKEKTQEDIDRNNLLNYFISVCCEPINYAVYNKQLKEIKQQYKDYTYKGMQYCLWYIHEHQKIPIKSIAIVPYYYEESKKYYQWLKDIKFDQQIIASIRYYCAMNDKRITELLLLV